MALRFSDSAKTSVNCSHGSPYDRGSADYYYRRDFNPHKMSNFKRIETKNLTEDEIQEYTWGWEDQELDGTQKDYGDE